jgi:hypothetical protein
MSLSRRCTAEFIGTFWLVLGGCGSAVLAAGFPRTGIGFAGVALAFGLTLLTMAYAIRAYIRVPHQSGGDGRTMGGRPFPRLRGRSLHNRTGPGWNSRVGDSLRNRERRRRFRFGERLCRQWIRGAFARRLQSRLGDGVRGSNDVDVPVRDYGRDRQTRAGGFRADPDRARVDADPPYQHSSHQHFGEHCTQHRSSPVRRRLGTRTIVAILARTCIVGSPLMTQFSRVRRRLSQRSASDQKRQRVQW